MAGLWQDLRLAARQARKNRGFSVMAVLTLALGIGASTAMFGVINAVLLRPLPFPNSDRLVRVFSTQNGNVGGPSPLDLRDFAARNNTFEKLVVYDTWRKNVSPPAGSGEPEQRPVGLVPAGYFDVLGIKPYLGRFFTDEENRWGNQFEAVLSYEFWQTRFRGDQAVLGKSIRINDELYTIIGILPKGLSAWWFEGPHGRTEIWTPFAPYASVWQDNARSNRDFSAIGRLKPGVGPAQAQADLQRIAANLAARYPQDRGVGVLLRPLQEDRVGNLRPTVRLLMGAVILILLIACSNVANLLLVRNSGRTREIAVRMAIGAERGALIRQFMSESLLLGTLGGAGGFVVAWSACSLVSQFHPAPLPQLQSVHVDFRVALFACGLSLLASVLFGAIPAWIGSGVNLSEAFKESSRGTVAAQGKQRVRRSFVVTEIGLAVMLLIGTGLLLQSLVRLQKQEPGFREDHLLRSHLFLPSVRYPSPASITRFCDEYASRVRQLPGVQDAVISAAHPPDDQWMQSFTIVNRPVSNSETLPSATFNVTDPHFLRTLGIPLLRGRDFAEADTETSVPVALVNDKLVRTYFPNEDPIGKQILFSEPFPATSPSTRSLQFTIIGVTGDFMNRGLELPAEPQITALYRQTPDLNYGFKNLIVRTALNPLQLAAPIRQQLHSLDPNLPFAEVSTVDQLMYQETADRRYTTVLLGLFALAGVLLAGLGVYGVVSYAVSQRTGEIGLRIALGAQRTDVLWMIVKHGMVMACAGAIAGLAGAWMVRQSVAQLVFGISPADPLTYFGAAIVLVTFAGIASYLPARRAAKVDPLVALRYE